MKTQPSHKIINTRRSSAQWQAIMAAYEASHLTQEVFCAQQSLAPSTFYKGRKQLTTEKVGPEEKPLFFDVTALSLADNKPPCSEWDVELSLGNGITLRLRHPA